MKKIDIYTDGACSGNPGKGGWAAVLCYKETEKEIAGFSKQTTNNRMELLAVIKAISVLKEKCIVTVYSDSAYVVNAFIKGWVTKWEQKKWKKTTSGNELKNPDLWEELYDLSNKHIVTWVKVKGHSDNEYNNRCDAMAVDQIKINSD